MSGNSGSGIEWIGNFSIDLSWFSRQNHLVLLNRHPVTTECKILFLCFSLDSLWLVCVAFRLLPVIHFHLSAGGLCTDCVYAFHSQPGKWKLLIYNAAVNVDKNVNTEKPCTDMHVSVTTLNTTYIPKNYL